MRNGRRPMLQTTYQGQEGGLMSTALLRVAGCRGEEVLRQPAARVSRWH